MELSFTRTWDPSDQGEHAPLYIDKRYNEEDLNPFFFETRINVHGKNDVKFVGL